MRAAVCPAYGPPEVVEVRELPEPESAAVRVVAAAVNFPDVLLVAGRYQVTVPPPFVVGSEFAGVVEVAGGGFAAGERVTGTGITGAFAELVSANALHRIPDGVPFDVAAAAGVAHGTAYHALRAVARVGAGDRVIVLGAGGGVGLAAVQLATALGAEVTAVASTPEKRAVARSYGAATVDSKGDLRAALRTALPDGAQAVLDPVGGDVAEPALRSLARGGRYVTIGFASGVIPRIPLNLVLIKGIQLLGCRIGDLDPELYRTHRAELAALLADGTVRPHIGARYPLAETAAALRLVADGRAVGKVLIEP
ncbi:NADPH:quinone oxidoreductase family protein [Nocardia harenae]|uniref:NADPH:quinone oxidoreductase family protein n=1 Tax=Nocardia harenae TaxID=358707 RepID=UPI00082E57F0|nr:NADPH:quinone oxidoreductase family protein [Nocardia harenae]